MSDSKIRFGVGRAAVPDVGKGFETLDDIERRRRQDQNRAQANTPAVRPAILIAAALAGVLLLFVVFFFANESKKTAGIDAEAAWKDFVNYRHEHPGEPAASEDIRQRLIAIAMMENTGRKPEAAQEWKRLLLLSGAETESPLYKLSAQRVKDDSD